MRLEFDCLFEIRVLCIAEMFLQFFFFFLALVMFLLIYTSVSQ